MSACAEKDVRAHYAVRTVYPSVHQENPSPNTERIWLRHVVEVEYADRNAVVVCTAVIPKSPSERR